MPNASFSLSISSRGNDFVIGGSGILNLDGVASLRQTLEESCKKEGASILLDLMLVSELHPDAIPHLVSAADFCRGVGVPFSVSFSADVLEVLSEAGYDAELMPLVNGQ
jgi:anti-anti-sigma regulatory factor